MGVMYPSAPGISAILVTPNDNADLPRGVCRAIEILSAGNVVTVAQSDPDSGAITRTGYPVGTVIPVCVRRVKATGTTATIAALY